MKKRKKKHIPTPVFATRCREPIPENIKGALDRFTQTGGVDWAEKVKMQNPVPSICTVAAAAGVESEVLGRNAAEFQKRAVAAMDLILCDEMSPTAKALAEQVECSKAERAKKSPDFLPPDMEILGFPAVYKVAAPRMIKGIDRPRPGSGLDLKPCPFCGWPEIYYVSYETPVGDRWQVVCGGCMAGIDTGWAQTPGQLTNRWNRRV